MEIDVLHIAKLSNLSLDMGKAELFSSQMKDIVDMMSVLPECGECESDVIERVMPLRKDEVQDSFPREKILFNAPETAEGYFVVPRTVD